MDIKLRQLLSARQAIVTLANRPVKAKTAYCISKNRALINDALRAYDIVIDELIRRYGRIPDDGSPPVLEMWKLTPETQKDITGQIDELLDVTENIAIRKIPGGELDKIDITPAEMELLEFMIEIPEAWDG